ncbi:MAG TPA: MarC family protein [Acidobacteriaceae bacterium]|jgi:multiple antibiotic resistance protein|nr:MarC family protein [Acidobacteriaceae bacterium]
MGKFFSYFSIGFSTLFPLINPVGSALIFLGLVGPADRAIYKRLARKIALITVLFLLTVDFVGSFVLRFFGVSLPVVEVAGGLVIASMGWRLLNEPDRPAETLPAEAVQRSAEAVQALDARVFYPFTFPITAGPGTVVVMLALAAHAEQPTLLGNVFSQLGLFAAVVVLCVMVYFSYAYAPTLTRKISPQTTHGILRIISFLLLAIGIQIFWRGADKLLLGLMHSH